MHRLIERFRAWLSGRRATREFRQMAATARHPYQDRIAELKPRGFFLNCRMVNSDGTFNRPFGPQCDLPEGVDALAVDDLYVYANDGCRYRRKA